MAGAVAVRVAAVVLRAWEKKKCHNAVPKLIAEKKNLIKKNVGVRVGGSASLRKKNIEFHGVRKKLFVYFMLYWWELKSLKHVYS